MSSPLGSLEPATAELSKTQILHMEYCVGFDEYCLASGESFSLKRSRPQHWNTVSAGPSRFLIDLTSGTTHR
jgi:hypothetical protein